MKEERTPDMIDSDNLRLAMETGTLPPSGELERYFLPQTARQMLPLHNSWSVRSGGCNTLRAL